MGKTNKCKCGKERSKSPERCNKKNKARQCESAFTYTDDKLPSFGARTTMPCEFSSTKASIEHAGACCARQIARTKESDVTSCNVTNNRPSCSTARCCASSHRQSSDVTPSCNCRLSEFTRKTSERSCDKIRSREPRKKNATRNTERCCCPRGDRPCCCRVAPRDNCRSSCGKQAEVPACKLNSYRDPCDDKTKFWKYFKRIWSKRSKTKRRIEKHYKQFYCNKSTNTSSSNISLNYEKFSIKTKMTECSCLKKEKAKCEKLAFTKTKSCPSHESIISFNIFYDLSNLRPEPDENKPQQIVQPEKKIPEVKKSKESVKISPSIKSEVEAKKSDEKVQPEKKTPETKFLKKFNKKSSEKKSSETQSKKKPKEVSTSEQSKQPQAESTKPKSKLKVNKSTASSTTANSSINTQSENPKNVVVPTSASYTRRATFELHPVSTQTLVDSENIFEVKKCIVTKLEEDKRNNRTNECTSDEFFVDCEDIVICRCSQAKTKSKCPKEVQKKCCCRPETSCKYK